MQFHHIFSVVGKLYKIKQYKNINLLLTFEKYDKLFKKIVSSQYCKNDE